MTVMIVSLYFLFSLSNATAEELALIQHNQINQSTIFQSNFARSKFLSWIDLMALILNTFSQATVTILNYSPPPPPAFI